MYFRRTIPHGLKFKNKGECKQRTTHLELVLGQVPVTTGFFKFILVLFFYLLNDAPAAQTIEVRIVWSLVKSGKGYERKRS